MALRQPGETLELFQTNKPNILLLSSVPYELHVYSKNCLQCPLYGRTVPQFKFVPYDLDKLHWEFGPIGGWG